MQHGTSVVPCCAAPRGPSRHRPSHQRQVVPWHFAQRLRSRDLSDSHDASVIRRGGVLCHFAGNTVRRRAGARLCTRELLRVWRVNRTYAGCAGPPVLWVWLRLSRVLVVNSYKVEIPWHVKNADPNCIGSAFLSTYALGSALPRLAPAADGHPDGGRCEHLRPDVRSPICPRALVMYRSAIQKTTKTERQLHSARLPPIMRPRPARANIQCQRDMPFPAATVPPVALRSS